MKLQYEYLNYYHKLNDAEKLWVKNFYAAYYGQSSWSDREDIYSRFTKADTTTEEIEQFMEKPAALESDFEQVFKTEGYAAAAKFVVKSAIYSLEQGANPERVLLNFYQQFRTLERFKKAEKRGYGR